MSAVARMIDANANRAREALRVMEDAARFVLDDSDLSSRLKSIRHDLRTALDRLTPGWLEANRDTPGDVGTSITTESEVNRASLHEVAIAAGKRLSEALRVIEEAGKTIDPDFAASIGALRYRAYDAESALHLRLGSGKAKQWRVCVLLTESLCELPWEDVLRSIVDGGADCIQVREKEMPGGELTSRVRKVTKLAQPAGVSVIVNDLADVALAAGADGVHVGRHDMSVRDVRRIAGRSLIVGVSTHDLNEAQAAVEAGADYCGVGAMFKTPLKPGRHPSGPAYLRAFIERYPQVPHLAIGGITPQNVHELVDAGVCGVAASSAVCAADDPGAVVTALREALTAGESG
ncbi:MAG: thiamine phosphate synthase [Phycisphaerales bacterium]|nr:MAG: thiamine phosphate synthase [Phycisphaerales bacterium]